jgi:hypothetical protein
MWIVKLALKRPYTFVVLAILILIFGGSCGYRESRAWTFLNIDKRILQSLKLCEQVALFSLGSCFG